jgi:ABC-2 type transport system permease protein
MSDLMTMIWKEGKELLVFGGGRRRGRFSLIVPVVVLGVFLPLQEGAAWVSSPIVLLLSGWLPLLMVSSVVADSFAGERERHTLETLLASRLADRAILFGKMLAATVYGWACLLASLLVALITLNVTQGGGRLLIYSAPVGLGAVALGLLTSILAAGAGVLVSLRAASVRQAQQTLSLAVMLLLFVPIFGLQALPAAWQARMLELAMTVGLARAILVAAGVLAVLDVLLVLAAAARFRRTRLILD